MNIDKFSDKQKPSGFLAPLFEECEQEIKIFAQKFKDSSYFFILGIGGSNLATKAVYSAINKEKENKKVFFIESLDNSEEEEIKRQIDNIKKIEDVCITVSSKSGNTKETLDAFRKVSKVLIEKFGENINQRIIIITGKKGKLREISTSHNITIVDWEGEIGGRFSAFSIVHTLPLSILGLDTEKLKEGGRLLLEDRPALDSIQKLTIDVTSRYKEGVNILDIFSFNSELESLGKWSRQLVAESLGKTSQNGEHIDLTPTVSIGPRDLHSMLQLYLGGQKKRYTIFLYSKKEGEGSIKEKSFLDTKKAYLRENLPHDEFLLEKVDEYNIGRYFAFMMLLVVNLAQAFEVNAYDQGAVEDYKKTFRISNWNKRYEQKRNTF